MVTIHVSPSDEQIHVNDGDTILAGLYETLQDTSTEGNKRVLYKGWDEWDHHSVGTMESILQKVFGFYATERVQISLDDDHECIGTWMTGNNQVHQMAVIGGLRRVSKPPSFRSTTRHGRSRGA